MRIWRWLLPLVISSGLVLGAAGTLGAVGPGATGATAEVPEAKQSIRSMWRPFQKALRGDDCDVLGRYLMHSSSRRHPTDPGALVDPDAPFTAEECQKIEQLANAFDGFQAKKYAQLGTAALMEGTSPDVTAREGVFVAVWLLDRDGRWKAYYVGEFLPQVGTRPPAAVDFDGAVGRWVKAMQANDCREVWYGFLPDSPYVTDRPGGATQMCADLASAVQRGTGKSADMIGTDVVPKRLGATADLAVYGVDLPNGRYVTVLAMTTVEASAEHGDPGVYEYVTTRAPGKQG